MSWECGKGGKIVRWRDQRTWRVVRCQGGSFLVLFKDRGRRVSPRLHLIVFDVDQRNEGAGWVQDYLA